MIVGIDVYHKTFGGIRKSIFAFVATVDRYFAKLIVFYLHNIDTFQW